MIQKLNITLNAFRSYIIKKQLFEVGNNVHFFHPLKIEGGGIFE